MHLYGRNRYERNKMAYHANILMGGKVYKVLV